MGEVTEALCQARTATFDTKLDTISRDVEETRKGVGKLNRRLFEGNGSAALDTVILSNTEFRLAMIEREEARRRFAWTRNLSWLLAGGGWAVGIILWMLQKS